jgi:hypothetical protein
LLLDLIILISNPSLPAKKISGSTKPYLKKMSRPSRNFFNQTLREKFQTPPRPCLKNFPDQSDLAQTFSGTLCSKNFQQTLPAKSQPDPQKVPGPAPASVV